MKRAAVSARRMVTERQLRECDVGHRAPKFVATLRRGSQPRSLKASVCGNYKRRRARQQSAAACKRPAGSATVSAKRIEHSVNSQRQWHLHQRPAKASSERKQGVAPEVSI